jgi:hypothetical protein
MRVEAEADIFSVVLEHYASSDLVSAGLKPYQLDALRGGEMTF